MLFLKNTPIHQILSMNEIIEVIESTLKEVACGRGFELPRRRIHHPNRMIFGLLPGSVQGAMGAYIQTDLDRRLHGETVILYSVETGEPLILYQDCSINEARTGAAGALGAKHLARPEASRAAVIGSAAHAQMQLAGLAAVRRLSEVKIYSPTAAHRADFADKARRELNIDVTAASSAQQAVETAEIVIVATDSKRPVIDGAWLKPGVHITSIANGDKTRIRQEIDAATLGRADRIFVTSKETIRVNESDIFRAAREQIIRWDRVHEIADLLLGRTPGRTDTQQITLFKLQGMGVMDVAVGLRAYERLKGGDVALRI